MLSPALQQASGQGGSERATSSSSLSFFLFCTPVFFFSFWYWLQWKLRFLSSFFFCGVTHTHTHMHIQKQRQQQQQKQKQKLLKAAPTKLGWVKKKNVTLSLQGPLLKAARCWEKRLQFEWCWIFLCVFLCRAITRPLTFVKRWLHLLLWIQLFFFSFYACSHVYSSSPRQLFSLFIARFGSSSSCFKSIVKHPSPHIRAPCARALRTFVRWKAEKERASFPFLNLNIRA